MTELKDSKISDKLFVIYEFVKVFFFVYCFLVSIDMMGMAFKASGAGFTDALKHATSNPFIGLVLGIVITSIIQSSSTTTSIVVTMVGVGTISLENAIPIIMGANIGTTVTNTIVSFGYAGRKTEFELSFGAAIVHDMFNILAVLIFFPIERYTGIIYKSANFLTSVFEGIGGFKFVSPLKTIIRPVSGLVERLVDNHWALLIIALVFLFYSMSRIVANMKGIVMEKVETVLNRYLFRNVFISFLLGMLFTALVQSSSIATSIIVPLVGSGILKIEQIFPYTLGANIGTTITAMLAALTVGVEASMAVAFSHLLFNVFGILIIFPVKRIPIWMAKSIASYVVKSKKHFLIFLLIYLFLHFIPIIFVLF